MHKIHLFLALMLCCALPVRSGGLTVIAAIEGADASAMRLLQRSWQESNLRVWSSTGTIETLPAAYWPMCSDATLATLLTGVMPAQHGICSDSAFNRETRQAENIFLSTQALAIGTARSYACDALLTPTMTDRLRMRRGTEPRIYAIGLCPTTTMVLAGKSANACCWLEKKEGGNDYRWVSTSYYQQGLPSSADRMNISGELNRLMRHQDVNIAVTELALMLQMEKQLGTAPDGEDVLLLQLSNTQTLGGMMETLLRRVGKDALHLVVIGLPTAVQDAQRAEWHMATQTFNLDRALALTSSYLMALYGYERWLDGGFDHSIYLNKGLIMQKGLSIETMRRQVAEFLMEFDGVRYACPVSEAYLRNGMQDLLHKRFAGDVVFELQSNYTPMMTQTAVMVVNEDAQCTMHDE